MRFLKQKKNFLINIIHPKNKGEEKNEKIC
jgi:hypothetical protein